MHPETRRGDPPMDPDAAYRLTLEMLDFSWYLAVGAELAAGAESRDVAEARVGERWKREDARRLREKLDRWKTLERARLRVR